MPTLRAAVAEDPLRERAWAQLMVALYRCGRQADALAAYRAAQRALAELGLAPGPQLRELERMVLLQDAALDAPARADIPRYGTSFLGRDADARGRPERARAGRLVTVVGRPASARRAWRSRSRPASGCARGGSISAPRAPGGSRRRRPLRSRVPQVPGRAAADLVAARLAERPALLLLDNCEHVADEAARLAARLLERRPRGSSRRAASRCGSPASGSTASRARAAACDPPVPRPRRTRRGRPDAVTELVERLDGLPLAIELAAGKLPWVSAAELARDLHERLSLLGDGPRTAPARQRTLEAAIAWSYELLADDDRAVLRRLSVFPGSFDAAAAQAVTAVPAVLPALTRLADASLVVAEHTRRLATAC